MAKTKAKISNSTLEKAYSLLTTAKSLTEIYEANFKSFDVFEENRFWLNELDKLKVRINQIVALVFFLSPACEREALAWRSARNEVNLSAEGNEVFAVVF